MRALAKCRCGNGRSVRSTPVVQRPADYVPILGRISHTYRGRAWPISRLNTRTIATKSCYRPSMTGEPAKPLLPPHREVDSGSMTQPLGPRIANSPEATSGGRSSVDHCLGSRR